MLVGNQDVSLSDMQWKQVEEVEKIHLRFQVAKKFKKISSLDCS